MAPYIFKRTALRLQEPFARARSHLTTWKGDRGAAHKGSLSRPSQEAMFPCQMEDAAAYEEDGPKFTNNSHVRSYIRITSLLSQEVGSIRNFARASLFICTDLSDPWLLGNAILRIRQACAYEQTGQSIPYSHIKYRCR